MNKRFFAFLSMAIGPYLILSIAQPDHYKVMAIFISIVMMWFTEIVPLAVTGLMVPLLAILYGAVSTKEAFAPFGNQILFLFMGSFFIAKAMEKHGWDKRMAYTFLSSSFGAKSLQGVLVQVALICWILSMWISNTATCAIVVPIILGLMDTLKDNLKENKHQENLQTSFLLTAAFASSIGGMATPVGSPPNLMAIQFLKNKGINISFLEWMGYGLPVSLAMLGALILILKWRYPLPKVELKEVRKLFKVELESLGKTKKTEWQIMAVFLMAVILWILPGVLTLILPLHLQPMAQSIQDALPMGGVGVLASAFLFVLPGNKPGETNLSWSEANTIDWGTIWLFGGGLAMGSLLDKSGLAADVGGLLFGGGINFYLLALIVIMTGVILSEFSSNTASTAILVPLLLGSLSIWGEVHTTSLIIAAAFGASFGFMLPVSTPPNAIVFGTGKLPLKEMIKTGSLFDVTGIAIIWLFLSLGLIFRITFY
jgi:sodium-dependent dicarboxylate transporter 2/3/5